MLPEVYHHLEMRLISHDPWKLEKYVYLVNLMVPIEGAVLNKNILKEFFRSVILHTMMIGKTKTQVKTALQCITELTASLSMY